jgi:DnaJ domain
MTSSDSDRFETDYFDVHHFDLGRAATDASEPKDSGTDRAGSDRSDDGSRSFPGGATRLPRLSKPGSPDPDVLFVESAFFKEPPVAWPESTPLAGTGFGQYYSTESLFDPTVELFVEPDRNDGPYAVLGLTRRANWQEIAKAHRKLVSELHPDRYVGADETVREAAERRVRDVNEAYAEIRRERATDQGD